MVHRGDFCETAREDYLGRFFFFTKLKLAETRTRVGVDFFPTLFYGLIFEPVVDFFQNFNNLQIPEVGRNPNYDFW